MGDNKDLKGLVPVKPGDKRKGHRPDIWIDAKGKRRWSTHKLERELGDLLKGKKFAIVKSDYLKKHKQDSALVNSWFVSKGRSLYFDPDCLDVLKEKFFCVVAVVEVPQIVGKKIDKSGNTGEAHDGLLRLEELADALNLPDVAAVSNVKWRLLEYHKKNKNAEEYEKFRNMVEGWFVKFGRVKFFKSLHYAEFQSLLQEMPHKKGRPGGKKLVINQVVKDEPEKVSPMERDAPAGGRVEGWVVCGENPQGDEVQKLLALVEGTGLAQVATRILDVLAGQIAKSYGARSEPSGRDKLNEDFYNVKDALVEQTKAEQKFMEARQKILEAEQHLKAVVEKYLSKNI